MKRKQRKEEAVEQFHLALRGLAAHFNLRGMEDELIQDLFIANMYDQESQKELLNKTLDPEEALEKAMTIEMGKRVGIVTDKIIMRGYVDHKITF